MFHIQIYNRISEKGLAQFEAADFRLGAEVAHPDAILLRSQKLHDLPMPQGLLAIARAGAGVNNIPVDACTEKGVVVLNTPGANANAVKELVVAGMLLAARDIFGGMQFVQGLTDIDDAAELAARLEAEKKRFVGSELAGKTLGVIGLGAIGSMVANVGVDLGMKVAGYDPVLSVDAAWRLSSRVRKMESLAALVRNCDFVTLHIPANEHTRGLIDAEVLAAFKPGSDLLNFAREEVVDHSALLNALDNQQLAKYVTDFPRPELLGRKDVLCLPHIGASTREAEENCAMMAADQLIDFLRNGNITNSVNFPETHMVRNGGHRITFSNRNVPRVLGTVLSILADRNINVVDMVNRSRGEIAYNIIDLDQAPDADTVSAITTTEAVIRVRVV